MTRRGWPGPFRASKRRRRRGGLPGIPALKVRLTEFTLRVRFRAASELGAARRVAHGFCRVTWRRSQIPLVSGEACRRKKRTARTSSRNPDSGWSTGASSIASSPADPWSDFTSRGKRPLLSGAYRRRRRRRQGGRLWTASPCRPCTRATARPRRFPGSSFGLSGWNPVPPRRRGTCQGEGDRAAAVRVRRGTARGAHRRRTIGRHAAAHGAAGAVRGDGAVAAPASASTERSATS